MSNQRIHKRNHFTLTARCRECGKHIKILFDISILEIPEFGKEERHECKEGVPNFLKAQLRNIQDNFSGSISTFKYKSPTTAPSPSAPICKNCELVEKLKSSP